MEKRKSSKEKNTTLIIFGMIIIMVLILIVILNSGREQHFSIQEVEPSTIATYCKGQVTDDPFFKRYNALSLMHEIKVTIYDNHLDRINYTYTAKHESEESATEDASLLHADYNIYMSKTTIDQEALLPTFSVINNDIIINYSVDKKTLTPETARLVFLNNEEYNKLLSYSMDDITSLYRKKGFHCEIIK